MHIPRTEGRFAGAQGLLDVWVAGAAAAAAKSHLDELVQAVEIPLPRILQYFSEGAPVTHAVRDRLERIPFNHLRSACSASVPVPGSCCGCSGHTAPRAARC